MSELTKEWLQQTIAELEEERDAVPGAVNEDALMALAAMKIAQASLEAEPVAWIVHARTGDQLTTDGGYVANAEGILGLHSTPLYTAPPAPEIVPLAIHDEDFEKALSVLNDTLDDCGDSERGLLLALDKVGIEVLSDARRAAMLQGANEKPELTVWYGSMPESNGKANWTAILHRKGEGRCMDGFTIDRSEYPGRVLYAADRVRYLIGEKSERPSILDYDADAHSGYVKPGNSSVTPDGWVLVPEEPTHEMLEAGDEQFGTYDVYRRMIAAAPQQEVK
ncbi:hypothetical protein P9874_014650 [Enterobacter hormaechei]|uniref:hypothetical protein n=1 Tax=Enterobacter hormaechei TaxID=158836 RepID=UPI00254E490B|nr:hypothetical protein [Enterobacter hormaechei]MEC5518055.1 hypothetical protein [Enterobacter hormaechei]